MNVNCAHAECQIIHTIRKLNKNIYKTGKRVREQYSQRNDEEESEFHREELNEMV
jgi:hypothetical protein